MSLTQVPSSMLGNSGSELGMRNRIINGAMGIWQRGTSFQPNSVLFGADRFASYKTGAAAGDYARSTDVPSTEGFQYSAYLNNADFRHSIELPAAGVAGEYLVGSTWTLSFWVKGASAGSSTVNIGWSNGVSAASLNNWGADQTFSFTTSWTKVTKTFTVSGTPTGSQPAILLYINSLGVAGYITGVQLEKGSVATAFDYRPYGAELALCQRYFQSWGGESTYCTFAMGVAYSTTAVVSNIILPVQMRTAPSLATTGSFAFVFNGNVVNATTSTVSLNQYSSNAVSFNFTSLTGTAPVQGNSVAVATNTSATRLQLSAEL